MAVSTLAEIKTSAADWLNRSDLTSQIDDFATLTLKEMQKFAHAIKTKANIPVGGCTLVDIVSPKYGKITNRFCKRGKNRCLSHV